MSTYLHCTRIIKRSKGHTCIINNEFTFVLALSKNKRKNFKFVIFQIDQAKLGLPSRKYYLDKSHAHEMQAYLDFQIKMATLLGANHEIVEKELKENLKFETAIANVRF